MPAFSPSTYLASQGWSGPGSGLRPDSRAKPVTVIKRKDLLGLGKERDSSFAWWDDVFKAVADKVGGNGTSRQPQVRLSFTLPWKLECSDGVWLRGQPPASSPPCLLRKAPRSTST